MFKKNFQSQASSQRGISSRKSESSKKSPSILQKKQDLTTHEDKHKKLIEHASIIHDKDNKQQHSDYRELEHLVSSKINTHTTHQNPKRENSPKNNIQIISSSLKHTISLTANKGHSSPLGKSFEERQHSEKNPTLKSLIALRLADAGNSKAKNPRSAQQSRDNSLSNVEANESRQNILNKRASIHTAQKSPANSSLSSIQKGDRSLDHGTMREAGTPKTIKVDLRSSLINSSRLDDYGLAAMERPHTLPDSQSDLDKVKKKILVDPKKPVVPGNWFANKKYLDNLLTNNPASKKSAPILDRKKSHQIGDHPQNQINIYSSLLYGTRKSSVDPPPTKAKRPESSDKKDRKTASSQQEIKRKIPDIQLNLVKMASEGSPQINLVRKSSLQPEQSRNSQPLNQREASHSTLKERRKTEESAPTKFFNTSTQQKTSGTPGSRDLLLHLDLSFLEKAKSEPNHPPNIDKAKVKSVVKEIETLYQSRNPNPEAYSDLLKLMKEVRELVQEKAAAEERLMTRKMLLEDTKVKNELQDLNAKIEKMQESIAKFQETFAKMASTQDDVNQKLTMLLAEDSSSREKQRSSDLETIRDYVSETSGLPTSRTPDSLYLSVSDRNNNNRDREELEWAVKRVAYMQNNVFNRREDNETANGKPRGIPSSIYNQLRGNLMNKSNGVILIEKAGLIPNNRASNPESGKFFKNDAEVQKEKHTQGKTTIFSQISFASYSPKSEFIRRFLLTRYSNCKIGLFNGRFSATPDNGLSATSYS